MDKEEKLLAEAYDQGLIKLEDPSADLMGMLKEAGDKTFKKDKRINIRLSSHDLLGIQQKAAQKGIPYQAFISGLIHQYVEGDLVEESHAKYRRKWLVCNRIKYWIRGLKELFSGGLFCNFKPSKRLLSNKPV